VTALNQRVCFGFAIVQNEGITGENLTFFTMQIKIIIRIVLITAFILSIPFVAMRFTDEVVWNRADFVIAGVLMFGSGLAFAIIVKMLANPKIRVISTVAILGVLILAWAELAVGIFGTPFAGS
jgi:hypothetical protein